MHDKQAFPITWDEGSKGNTFLGMTLRDYFAAHALALLDYDAVKGEVSASVIAADAYKIADAMIWEGENE